MDVFTFFRSLQDNVSTIRWLRQRNLLRKAKYCNACRLWCSQIRMQTSTDGYMFRCSHCRKKTSIRDASFFSGSHLPLRVIATVFYFFTLDVGMQTILNMLPGKISRPSLVDWLNFCRDICSFHMLRHPVRLGGPGEIVEIDESKWGKKRKYNRGAVRNEGGPWIFGMVERNRGKVLIWSVDYRDRNTLQPLIVNNVVPGSTIHSDEWPAYANLTRLGFNHHTVCHTDNFVAPDGTHTNTIEGFWGNAKQYFKQMRGVNRPNLNSHLDEVMWRWNNKTEPDLFAAFTRDIASRYPVNADLPQIRSPWHRCPTTSLGSQNTKTALLRATKLFRKEAIKLKTTIAKLRSHRTKTHTLRH